MAWSDLIKDARARRIFLSWKRAVFNTAPLHRARAVTAVSHLYRVVAGRAPPPILFFDSPEQALLALGDASASDDLPAVGQLDAALAQHLSGGLRGGLSAALNRLIRGELLEPAESALPDTTAFAARPRVLDLARHRLAAQTSSTPPALDRRTALDTAACIGWLAQMEFQAPSASGREDGPDATFVSALDRVCRISPWIWLRPDVAVLCERPEFVVRGLADWNTAKEGPILRFRDGFQIEVAQGAVVPRWLLANPGLITARHIERQSNIEIRRILLESMGIAAYIASSGAEKIAQDETGILWRRDYRLPHRGFFTPAPLAFVEVVNGSAEPDGSYRRYFLRVPPWFNSPRAAVAWTYGLDAEDYVPAIRT